jgi:hypothetical protein
VIWLESQDNSYTIANFDKFFSKIFYFLYFFLQLGQLKGTFALDFHCANNPTFSLTFSKKESKLVAWAFVENG